MSTIICSSVRFQNEHFYFPALIIAHQTGFLSCYRGSSFCAVKLLLHVFTSLFAPVSSCLTEKPGSCAERKTCATTSLYDSVLMFMHMQMLAYMHWACSACQTKCRGFIFIIPNEFLSVNLIP